MKHKFLNCDRVLCLSAHPDDAEYGMLGSWIQHGDTFFDVVVLSTGGDFDGSSGNSRLKECENIWDKFSNVKGQFADCGGKKLKRTILSEKKDVIIRLVIFYLKKVKFLALST